MKYTHVFISRPRTEAVELAGMLVPLGLQTVVQPAFDYFPEDIAITQAEIFAEMSVARAGTLVVFTSPRAVTHGLPQLPHAILFQSKIAAIGPATAAALGDAGIRVNVTPENGYTSEALLETLSRQGSAQEAGNPFAFIISAPGGRQTLLESLTGAGWRARLVMAYRPEPTVLDLLELGKLQEASSVLSIWTSANAMNDLSRRLSLATWFQLCRGDWLVISDRLKQLARAFGPARIHLASGPGNKELLAAVRSLL